MVNIGVYWELLSWIVVEISVFYSDDEESARFQNARQFI